MNNEMLAAFADFVLAHEDDMNVFEAARVFVAANQADVEPSDLAEAFLA